MTDAPSPFAPFMPAAQPTPAVVPPTETAKQKVAREKREAKAADKAAQAAKPEPDKSSRKKRMPTLKAHSPKFDLQTALAAFSLLNEADHGLFEKLIIMLDDAGKPQRDRLLAAIGKVFG